MKEIVSLRLDPDIRSRLEAASVEDDRPVSHLVRVAIAEWLDRRDAAKEKPHAVHRNKQR